MDEQTDIQKTVREFYGSLANDAGCCGGDCGCSQESACDCAPAAGRMYDPAELSDLPKDLADFSLGCGNPVSALDIREGETVLDLGSGGGLDCFLAARRVGPRGKVIGVDMTPEMIAKARANADRIAAGNVEFRLGRIEQIPAADGETDWLISNCVVNLSPDKPAVFREMFRVLRSGGRVAVSDIVTDGPMDPRIGSNPELWAECIAGALDTDLYRDGLAQAGFTGIEIKAVPMEGSARGESVPKGFPYSALITARKA